LLDGGIGIIGGITGVVGGRTRVIGGGLPVVTGRTGAVTGGLPVVTGRAAAVTGRMSRMLRVPIRIRGPARVPSPPGIRGLAGASELVVVGGGWPQGGPGRRSMSLFQQNGRAGTRLGQDLVRAPLGLVGYFAAKAWASATQRSAVC